MSSSTALLPGGSNRKNDHPIFLRACHSPWLSVSQKSLVFLRGSLATYLLVSSLLILHFELEVKKNRLASCLRPFQHRVCLANSVRLDRLHLDLHAPLLSTQQ
ncbi:hypothetical protein EYC84_010492 [Monilinia fructicola]|uniref:Uncharacterized protein n=1 Tax=Monilinia fructicola TaxID=38448 RepID=A0A5M9JDX3_MONFR|nr:hypothetical protein EYC84_010492 [Monilinia fructicola]